MERVLPIFKNEGFTYSVCLPEGASLDLGKHCILQTWNDFTSGTRGNLERSDLHFLMKMRGTSKLDSWAVDEHQKIYTTDIHRWWAKRLGVVGCMIIWLQKDGWQLASGKFLGLFVDGSPKNWGLQFFKWANSGYTWSVLWWYLGWWGWWATTGWSIMSCHGNRNSFDSWGHGTDGQASSWLANRPGKFWRCFLLKKCGRILRRFISATSEGLFACGWSSRLWSCCDFQHAVLLSHNFLWSFLSIETRRFHTENSLKLPSYVSTSSFCGCQNMQLCRICHTMSISKNMDPAFPWEGVVNLDVWKLLGPQLSVTIFVPCRL